MAEKIKEFEIRVRIRNNLLLQRREEAGLGAQELADRIGIGYQTYLEYESMKKSPVYLTDSPGRPKGQWRKTAIKIANYYCVEPEDLWPEVVKLIKKSEVKKRVDAEQVMRILSAPPPTPEELFLKMERNKLLTDGLNKLTDREREVLIKRFGLNEEEEKTLEELSNEIPQIIDNKKHITKERVRHIQERALRQLRTSKYINIADMEI